MHRICTAHTDLKFVLLTRATELKEDLMKIENKKEKENKTGNTWGRFHNTRDDCSILSYFDNENEIAVLVFSDLANL